MLFPVALKIAKYLGYFCHKICSQELSDIAQSGHTGTPDNDNGKNVSYRAVLLRPVALLLARSLKINQNIF